MMVITIGKSPDNDCVIDDSQVSRHHARLIRDADGYWLLEDLNSLNGTFVNGVQILKKRITPTDTIRLGKDCQLDFKKLLKSKNDYSEEFNALKKVYEEYTREKIKIQSANQFKTRLFQSLPFAFLGVVGIVINSVGKGSSVWYILCMLLVVCAPVVGVYLGARQSAKIPQQLQDLTNRFKIDYVCPKCGTFLGDIPWESLKNKKHCPVSSCQAKWTDE